jgi:hypothetical protein
MLCETCRWTGRPGFVQRPRTRGGDLDMIPCPECGGTGTAHCCDGICAQPEPGPPSAMAPRLAGRSGATRNNSASDETIR